MKYKILSEEIVFKDHFTIKKATIEHDSFVQSEPVEVPRLCFERGDSVAILLYETDTDTILFTNQFRYPSIKEGDGWILELTAGSVEEGEEPEVCANREIEEEIGYTGGKLAFISSFFVSPGGCSERIFLYTAEVQSTDKTAKGGGLESESEDIQLVKIPRDEIQSMLQNNEFRDAKTIIGLQWFMANHSVG
ncbi:MAG: nudix-type nucleoside diphosphatase (YffH/AdpP family) [Crocinitomicaceae bacterium]|jgi:nudix-type nucleoside diphosphatase (YffH/AdpP family)